MARALLLLTAICFIAFAVVLAIKVGDVDKSAGAPNAPGGESHSEDQPAPNGDPRLKTRPKHAPEIKEAAPDEERRWRVVVLSAEDEQPLEGAIVEAWPSYEITGTPQRLGTTDLKGVLEVASPRDAVTVLSVRKRGFVQARRDPTWHEEIIRLRPGLPVAGRVLRPDDTPIAGATVRTWDADSKYELSRSLTTDEAGRFEIDAVLPNRPIVVMASADGFAPRSVELAITGPHDGLIVRLGGGGVLAGAVTRHDGTPGAGLEVRLLPPRNPIPEGRQAEPARFSTPLTQTDSEGLYEFPDVPCQRRRESPPIPSVSTSPAGVSFSSAASPS